MPENGTSLLQEVHLTCISCRRKKTSDCKYHSDFLILWQELTEAKI